MAEKVYEWKQVEGTFPWMLQMQKPALPKREISYAENYRRTVVGEKPVWMPLAGSETDTCWPDVIEEHPVPEVDGFDYWGVEWQNVPIAGGMITKPGTRVIKSFDTWREDVVWPDIEAIDWAYDGEKISSRFDPERAHIYQCTEGIFERLHEMMPFDETLLAMALEPESALEFFHKMADYKIATIGKVFEHYGRIDGVLYHDDWGHQNSGFFSNAMFRELLMPPTKRVFDFIKSQGKYIELHSCGKNMQYMDEFIELGVDMWSPQLSGANDPRWLKENYGDKMTFSFPVEGLNEPDIDEATARQRVRDFVDFYGIGGRMVAGIRLGPDKADIAQACREELYSYSKEFYAKTL
ncbi:MAG: methyltransferase [Eubacteriaceae bacterium]|nr:methyltransferase [Eubacteriaceae bacterium]